MTIATKEDVAGWFEIDVQVLKGAKILFAAYETGDYEGSAFVLLSRDGKLYEVHGGHCSCHGLEDQWGEEEASIESVEHRLDEAYGFYLMDKDKIRTALNKFKAAEKRRLAK